MNFTRIFLRGRVLLSLLIVRIRVEGQFRVRMVDTQPRQCVTHNRSEVRVWRGLLPCGPRVSDRSQEGRDLRA